MDTIIDRSVIEKLSVAERLALVDLIWDTILDQRDREEPMSDELFNELERRAQRARENPATTFTMTEFEARLKARWK